jgi:hypothetical protein
LEGDLDEPVEDDQHLLADCFVLGVLGLGLRIVAMIELEGHLLEEVDEVRFPFCEIEENAGGL